MRDDTALAISKISRDISPEMIAASQGLYAAQHEREPYAGITVTRDQKYAAPSRTGSMCSRPPMRVARNVR